VLTTDQKTWFIQFYQKLSEYKRPVTVTSVSPAHRPMSSTLRQLEAAEDKMQVECRRLCAYNLPVSWQVIIITEVSLSIREPVWLQSLISLLV
jgi:hypothetical protein